METQATIEPTRFIDPHTQTTKAYRLIAQTFEARDRCIKDTNRADWIDIHTATIRNVVEEAFPSGSSIDDGVVFDFDASKLNKLVFTLGFHHMDDNGYYDGWTDHSLIVTPSLSSNYSIRLTGENYRDIKDYLYELLSSALDERMIYVGDRHVTVSRLCRCIELGIERSVGIVEEY